MAEDTGIDGIEDVEQSGVITALRKQVRELQAAVKDNDPSVVEAKVRAQVKRETEAATLMEKAGYPKLVDTFLAQVPDGEIDAAKASEFLDGLGLTPQEPSGKEDDASEGDGEEQEEAGGSVDPAAVAEIAGTGSDLAAKTAQAGGADPLAKIAAAESQEELIELAREGGYLQT